MKYNELLRQEYSGNNCIFSAGFVEGHPVDTMYLKLEKDGDEPTVILLRPDEMAIIAWLATGVLWSSEMSRMDDPPQSNIVLGRATAYADFWHCTSCGYAENVIRQNCTKCGAPKPSP